MKTFYIITAFILIAFTAYSQGEYKLTTGIKLAPEISYSIAGGKPGEQSTIFLEQDGSPSSEEMQINNYNKPSSYNFTHSPSGATRVKTYNRQVVSADKKMSADGPRLLVGINLITLPFKNKYIFIEGEIALATKVSLTARISYATLHQNLTNRINESKGAGLGVSGRYYFTGDDELKGFFTGLGFEVMTGTWEDFYRSSTDYGSYTALAPHVDIGYKFLLGKQQRFYLDPMVAIGFAAWASHSDLYNRDSSDVVFFGFPGLTFGIRVL